MPAKLDALVPEFLPAVPEDPYRAGPLYWNYVRRAVQNKGEEGNIPPVDPERTQLIPYGHQTYLFQTKAEEDARRAAVTEKKSKRGSRRSSGVRDTNR